MMWGLPPSQVQALEMLAKGSPGGYKTVRSKE